jgi:hypothetical protein
MDTKMKKFSLELANLGHPLCTRHGKKITQFIHIKEPYLQSNSDVLRAILPDGSINGYFINGRFNTHSEHSLDLFLDDSVEWEAPLKEGDEVEVYLSGEWSKRIFLSQDKHGNGICVDGGRELDYNESKQYPVNIWHPTKWRRIPKQEPKTKMDIKIIINDKEVSIEEFKNLIKDI